MQDAAKSDRKGRRGPQPLGGLVARTLDPLVARRGFATAELITRWAEIAGPDLARVTRPEQINWPRAAEGEPESRPGIVILRVEGRAALDVQHGSGQIVERINAYFGWRAVSGLRIRQGPVREREESRLPPARRLAAEEEHAIGERVGTIEDDGLRAALAALGRAATASRPRDRRKNAAATFTP